MDTIPGEIWAIIAYNAPHLLLTCARGAQLAAACRADMMSQWGVKIDRTAALSAIICQLPIEVFDVPLVSDMRAEIWTRNGIIHRKGGPAVVVGGASIWMWNGVPHREGGPAIIMASGLMKWYQSGKVHNEGAPAVVYPNGDVAWCRCGRFSRDDGPAIECKMGRLWMVNGQSSRQHGPPIELSTGEQYYVGNYAPAVKLCSDHIKICVGYWRDPFQ
jgi:hypothetical protein